MGLDLLDLTFRLEKAFGIKVAQADLLKLESGRFPWDVTAGELHLWVVQICNERGVKFPPSSWNRVRLELAKVVGKPPQVIRRETLVVRDLGFSC